MEGTGETEETGAVAEEGVAQRASNEVGGVGGNVSSLVVTMEGEVESEQVVEALVGLAALSEELSEVVGPVLSGVELLFANLLDLIRAEDQCCETGDLGEEGNAVIKSRLPVARLVKTVGISFGELGFGVQSRNCNGQLGHWVHPLGEGLDEVKNVLGDVRFLCQFAGKSPDLRGCRNLSGEEEPEHRFREHLSSRSALWQFLLAILDGFAVETDALVGVQHRALPDHSLQASHASNGAGNGHLANDVFTMLLDLLEQFPLCRNSILESSLEVRFCGRVVPRRGGKRPRRSLYWENVC